MNKEKLQKILEDHKLWLEDETKGKRANLSRADLEGAYLSRADLEGANLSRADLREANLREAYLIGAYLSRADLTGANLSGAILRGADLREADLIGADLRYAGLRGADLREANLSEADLSGAKLTNIIVDYRTIGYALACPETGSFIAYKKGSQGEIITLEIPADAKRSSATTNKCRASHAKVLEIVDKKGKEIQQASSKRGGIYKVGEITHCHEWDEDRWNECSGGIHFFMLREFAASWSG